MPGAQRLMRLPGDFGKDTDMNDGQRKNTPIENLLKAIAASGAEIHVLEVDSNPFNAYHKGVRVIQPETYARITAEDSTWSKNKQDLVTIMFHESGQDLFSSKIINLAVQCNDDQYAKLRVAFPEECKLADVARDRSATQRLIDEVMHLNYTVILENEQRRYAQTARDRSEVHRKTPETGGVDPKNN